jgi:hypothetical protein
MLKTHFGPESVQITNRLYTARLDNSHLWLTAKPIVLVIRMYPFQDDHLSLTKASI